MDVRTLLFPVSAQSDIVRSVQKDRLCLGIVESSVRDVVHGALGPGALVQYGDAIRAISSVLYYTCCTGVGQQTLGEEYCDLLQVSSAKLTPSISSRALLVLLHATLPLVHARLNSLEDASHDDWEVFHAPQHRNEDVRALEPPPLAAGTQEEVQKSTGFPGLLPIRSLATSTFNSASDLGEVLMADVAPVPADTLASPPNSQPNDTFPSGGSSPSPTGHNNGDRHWSSSRTHSPDPGSRQPTTGQGLQRFLPAFLPTLCASCIARLNSRWAAGWNAVWRSSTVMQAAKWLPLAAQIHLAFFYLFGLYYELPKRLTGTQYVYVGSSQVTRRYFGVMGLLIIVQAMVSAGQMCRRDEPGKDASERPHLNVTTPLAHPEFYGAVDGNRDDAQRSSLGPEGQDADVEFRAHGTRGGQRLMLPLHARTLSPCPLCLADRSTPTALPCGHVMCWKCAVEWCQRKPICPVCRHAAPLEQLVPLVHAVV